MSTTLDIRMAAAVLRILAKFGVAATLKNVSRGTISGGVRSPNTVTSQTVKMSPPLEMSTARASAAASGRTVGLTGSDVLETDLYVLMGVTTTSGAAVTAPNAKHDRVTIAGVEYAIWKVGTIYSGDDVAAYEMALRKS